MEDEASVFPTRRVLSPSKPRMLRPEMRDLRVEI
jgi:hypothetical protein